MTLKCANKDVDLQLRSGSLSLVATLGRTSCVQLVYPRQDLFPGIEPPAVAGHADIVRRGRSARPSALDELPQRQHRFHAPIVPVRPLAKVSDLQLWREGSAEPSTAGLWRPPPDNSYYAHFSRLQLLFLTNA